MSETLWWLWSEGIGWVRDAQGFPMIYHDPRIAGDCQDAIQEQRPGETIVVREVSVLPAERTLWGLWQEHGDGSCWALDHRGMPSFFYDKRVVMARKIAWDPTGEVGHSVREVGDDGYPVEPALEDTPFLVSSPPELAESPSLSELLARKENAEWDKLSGGTLCYALRKQPLDQAAKSVV